MILEFKVTQKDIDIAKRMYEYYGGIYLNPLSLVISKQLRHMYIANYNCLYKQSNEGIYFITLTDIYNKSMRIAYNSRLSLDSSTHCKNWERKQFDFIKPQVFIENI